MTGAKACGTAAIVGVEEVRRRVASVGASADVNNLRDGDVAEAGIAAGAAGDSGAGSVVVDTVDEDVVVADSEMPGCSDESVAFGRSHEQTRDWDNR